MTERRLPHEPRWITEAALLAIHAQQIERYGGAHGVVDQNVVLSAHARPRHRWHYDPTADLADLAASYLVGFARSHKMPVAAQLGSQPIVSGHVCSAERIIEGRGPCWIAYALCGRGPWHCAV